MKIVLILILSVFSSLASCSDETPEATLSNLAKYISVQTKEVGEVTNQINKDCEDDKDCNKDETKALITALANLQNNQQIDLVKYEDNNEITVLLFSNLSKQSEIKTITLTKIILKKTNKAKIATKWMQRNNNGLIFSIAGFTIKGVNFSLRVSDKIEVELAEESITADNLVLRIDEKSGLLSAEINTNEDFYILNFGKALAVANLEDPFSNVLENGKKIEVLISESLAETINFNQRFGSSISVASVNAFSGITKFIGQSIKFRYRRANFLLAARKGNIKRIIKFLKKDEDLLTVTNKRGMNALMFTAIYDQLEAAEYLLTLVNPLQIRAADRKGRSALSLAKEKHGESSEIYKTISNAMNTDADLSMAL